MNAISYHDFDGNWLQCDKHMVIYAWKLDTNEMQFFRRFHFFYFYSPKNGKQWSFVAQRLV